MKNSILLRTLKEGGNLILIILIVFCLRTSDLLAQRCGTPDYLEPPDPGIESTDCNLNLNFLNNHRPDIVPHGGVENIIVKINCIVLYKDDGTGNFDLTNSQQSDYLMSVLSGMNGLMENMPERSCACSTQPTYFTQPNIRFDFNIVKVNNTFYWNHENDQGGTSLANSKPYLKAIHDLAKMTAGYKSGIDIIFTVSNTNYLHYFANNGSGAPPNSKYGGAWYAAYPVDNLLIQPLIHCPDMYIDWKLNIPPLGGSTYGIMKQHSRSMLHEIGHHFGLNHTYDASNCGLNLMCDFNPGCDGENRDAFSGCQLRKTMETLMTKNIRNFVVCTDVIDHDVIVTQSETWSRDVKLYGDLRIKSGNTMTVTCKIELQENAKIIVERGGHLIIDGALLTSCDEKWHGIIVEGNSNNLQSLAGSVSLINNAIVENAKTAISCNPIHVPWPNNHLYGGLVKVENSTIRNCKKACEFMKYNLQDEGRFINATIENCDNGVTLWSTNGVRFDGCTFTNMTNIGIQPYDAAVKINNCTFNGAKYCISSESTIPGVLASEIGVESGNNFIPFIDGEGIRATSNGSIRELLITNNFFQGKSGSLGTLINGGSTFQIYHNDFVDNATGLGFWASQLNGRESAVTANNISYSNRGSVVNFKNYHHYWDNCFGFSQTGDIGITLGSIHPFQGSLNEAAGNCFTKNGTYDIKHFTSPVSIPFSNQPFLYYEPNAELSPMTCRLPRIPVPTFDIYPPTTPDAFYTVLKSNDNVSETCGSPNSPGIIDIKYRSCPIPKTSAEYDQMVTFLNQWITYFTSLPSLSHYQKYVLQTYKDCLKKIKVNKVIIIKETGASDWKNQAIAHLNGLDDFQSRIYAYGLMVDDEKYPQARTWLNSLTQNTDEIQDFVVIQNINLDYLENRGTYILSSANKTLLYNLGLKIEPLNGYARSLYFVLTGERIPISIDYGDGATSPRTKKDVAIVPYVKSYPNPVYNQAYTIELFDFEPTGNYTIEVYNVIGSIQYTKSFGDVDRINIDVDSWKSGLYVYKIVDSRKRTISSSKFVKL
jgi:hypothetical protein